MATRRVGRRRFGADMVDDHEAIASSTGALAGLYPAPPVRPIWPWPCSCRFISTCLPLSLERDRDALDGFLHLDRKSAGQGGGVCGLVFLLAVHFFGGLRLLALEWLPWSRRPEDLRRGADRRPAARCPLACSFFLQLRCLIGNAPDEMQMIDRHDTDILILGSGGAGLFAALHAHAIRANPDLEGYARGQGPDRQMRLHAHGPGRLQRCARAGRHGRAPFHGHDRRRQVAARPGHWPGAWCKDGGHVRILELENEIGCFFDRNPDGTLHGTRPSPGRHSTEPCTRAI